MTTDHYLIYWSAFDMSTATTINAIAPRKTRRKPGEPPQPLEMPFTVIVDSREQAPFTFTGIVGDSADRYRPLIVPVRMAGLPTGDYSIAGMEHLCCVERKSAADLVSTLASGRERFEAEHQRMMAFRTAAVVIESELAAMLVAPPIHSRMSMASVVGTYITWTTVKYRIPWIFCAGRRFAEIVTFKILRKFYETEMERISAEI
jgi:ERCC4-type nuclease